MTCSSEGGPLDIKRDNPFGYANHTWTIIYHELAHDTFASLHMHYKNKPHQKTKKHKRPKHTQMNCKYA